MTTPWGTILQNASPCCPSQIIGDRQSCRDYYEPAATKDQLPICIGRSEVTQPGWWPARCCVSSSLGDLLSELNPYDRHPNRSLHRHDTGRCRHGCFALPLLRGCAAELCVTTTEIFYYLHHRIASRKPRCSMLLALSGTSCIAPSRWCHRLLPMACCFTPCRIFSSSLASTLAPAFALL